jgi:hypothetical protein
MVFTHKLAHRLTRTLALSARLRGEREGTRRVGEGEGEVGGARARGRIPHLTPTLSAPGGGEGERAALRI